MNKKCWVLLIVLLHYTLVSWAGIIKGTVSDVEGVLPYTTVFLEGGAVGATTNGQGVYELQVSPGTYTVVCKHIGYQVSYFSITITGDETVTHDFMLQPQALEMNEVVIYASAEDPAYRIIREAIKKRSYHLAQVRNFHTKIYLKGVVRIRSFISEIMGQKIDPTEIGLDTNGKGILYFLEEEAEYYTDGDKERTVIHAVRTSGGKGEFGLSEFPRIISFYENKIRLQGGRSKYYLSPVGEQALQYYRYKLVGEFNEQGRAIYKIEVQPRRPYEPCFKGTIYIVDEDWAIHSLQLAVTNKEGLEVMDTLMIDQLYLPVQENAWIIKNQLLHLNGSFLGVGIAGDMITVYNSQKVNHSIPDSIFKDKLISSYSPEAVSLDTSYFSIHRPLPLEEDEIQDYRIKDSIYYVVNSPAYIDSMRRRSNRTNLSDVLFSGKTWQGKDYRYAVNMKSVLQAFHYNAVEGFVLAPKFTWQGSRDSIHVLQTAIAPRYGFSNRHFNAMGSVGYTKNNPAHRGRYWHLGVQGGKYVFQYNPEAPVPQMYNTIAALLLHRNDIKLYERIESTAFLERDQGNGLKWRLRLSYQQRMPLDNTSGYSFKNANTPFESNTPPVLSNRFLWEQHDAVLAQVRISYKPGFRYIQYPGFKTAREGNAPMFTLTYDKGIPGMLNSKTDFDKYHFSVEHGLNLKTYGSLSYNLAAGGFLNARYVSLPDLTHLHGNRMIGIAAPYLHSFQLAPFYDFSNADPVYFTAHLEYKMLGFLSNKVPLLRQARWYFLVGNNSFYNPDRAYYTEAFVGINNIGYKLVRVFRIDFVQAWDSKYGRTSGIRVGIEPGRLSSEKARARDAW